ncbi:His-Xaa-Ser system radical SAM maturase HxsB [Flammeovirga sp. SubArs3]|uniref:His-Xaa-Ser system radical SAM maturase HxsB n=1 Tax=Flammeovirga sp. SubArs3 TaxID=2995316 RepID=UPI00248C387C|nr:His-Xaa-Ser system radical SAM maturase HxsB [Flammeovirga sp. SubArs3]
MRKFNTKEFYNSFNNTYHLLPFKFHRLKDRKEIIVNEVGDFLIEKEGTVADIIHRNVDESSELYQNLLSKFFISESVIPELIDIYATRYRTKKSFLDHFTGLHIFVITLRCNHSCHYCQVSRKTENQNDFDMSYQDIDLSIDLMFKTPSASITMEFQGGEPLLAFDKVKYSIERAKELNKHFQKDINFVICTNLTPITDDMLRYCLENNVLLSMSLDGPEYVHNQNRAKTGTQSYELVVNALNKSREIVPTENISALMTTTLLSLDYPKEIIDNYIQNGFNHIFLRAISPYGFALKNSKKNIYETEKYIEFYKKGLLYILELNKNGHFFVEDYASIVLKKILTPFTTGFVDLQSPSGVINGVVVYNYDGYVYASDESRMLAENKDFTFQLGHVSDNYADIFYGEKSEAIAQSWALESLNGCSDCGLQVYCGADPVRNHATQNDMEGHRPTSTHCMKNMAIIEFLFELIADKESGYEKIFRSWINNNSYE